MTTRCYTQSRMMLRVCVLSYTTACTRARHAPDAVQMHGPGQFGYFEHKYVGDFVHGVRNGQGEFVCISKDRYKGPIVDGQAGA